MGSFDFGSIVTNNFRVATLFHFYNQFTDFPRCPRAKYFRFFLLTSGFKKGFELFQFLNFT